MVLTKRKSSDFLGTYHIELVDASLAHLSPEVVLKCLDGFRVPICLIEAISPRKSDRIVLAQGQLFHDFLEL